MSNWPNPVSPVLTHKTARLELIADHHAAGLEALVYNPDLWTYFTSRIDTPADFKKFMHSALDETKNQTRFAYVIIDAATNSIAGSMSYGNLAPADRRLEIGWSWLGGAFHGTGLNRHAKTALLTQAFERLEAERVEFKTDVLNQRARKGLLNIGATEEGVLRSFNYMPGGRRRDAIYYSILRAEWPAVKEMLLAKG